MTDPMNKNSKDDGKKRPPYPAFGFENTEVEATSFQDAFVLEGLLRKIGQDCRKEPLQYLERTQAWQEGE